MQKLVREYLNELKSRQKKRRRTVVAVVLLMVLVVSSVIGVLMQYGVAMTGNAKCNLEEHQHSKECYTSEIVCGMEEGEGHTHTDECYETKSVLSCGMEEGEGHTHTDECYGEDGVLICQEEESEGHVHTEDCYQTESVLVCQKEESEGHVHTEDCKEQKLVCGKEEHKHTDECYIDTEAGVEDASVWEEQYNDIEWKGNWSEDLVIAAEQQTGYKENSENYAVAEDESHKGYTRYGQFAGDVYVDWDAAFVNFCLHYAGIKESGLFPDETDTARWREEFEKINNQNREYTDCFSESKEYVPKQGDIIFFQKEDEETAYQMGIVSFYDEEKDEIEVIEGNSENEVQKNKYSRNDSHIDSYLKLAELEAAYKDKEEVTASDPEENKNVVKNTKKMFTAVNKEVRSDVRASVPVEEGGRVVLELLYDDLGNYQKYPEGVEYYTDARMSGYFTLTTEEVPGNIELGNMVMKLHFPKQYIQNNITVSKINASFGEFTIHDVKEEDDEYVIQIDIKKFLQTADMSVPFRMQFKDGEVPKDYRLEVYATLETLNETGDTVETGETAKYIYRPKYDVPEITKYVNTNRLSDMWKDDTKVSCEVTDQDEGEIAESEYVSFWFHIKQTHMRAYDHIVLTDTLPKYETVNGEMATAEFRQEDQQIGTVWTLSEDKKSVSCKITVPEEEDISPDERDEYLKNKIAETELRLRFPNCKLEKQNEKDEWLTQAVLNEVQADCKPYFPAEGETGDICKDDIRFILTAQPGGEGDFTKYNSANVITDTEPTRSSEYWWGMRFVNTDNRIPFKNIVFGDGDDQPGKDNAKSLLDERLKFKSIKIVDIDYDLYSRLDKIELIPYNGENEFYNVSDIFPEPNAYKESLWTLPEEREYKGFRVYLKSDYEMKIGESVHIKMSSVFRKPEQTHFSKTDSSKNIYRNVAYVKFNIGDDTLTTIFLHCENKFELIEAREDVGVKKDATDWTVKNNEYEAGKSHFWSLSIDGILDENKSYDDLRILDLLPEGFSWEKRPGDSDPFAADYQAMLVEGGGVRVDKEIDPDGIIQNKNYKPTIIENYKNTGRTALIFDINVEEVKNWVKNNGSLGKMFTFWLSVDPEAVAGSGKNEAFLISDDLEDTKMHNTTTDIYDVDEDGNKTDQVRYASVPVNITTNQAVYSRKYIAPENSEDWRTTGLFLRTGENFQYKLNVSSVTSEYEGLEVYDALPRIGDRSIFGDDRRKSEFTVNLSEFIHEYPGYKIYYTTSNAFYNTEKGMEDVIKDSNVEWFTEEEMKQKEELGGVTSYKKVSAFKIVAENGTKLTPTQEANFIIPVKVTDVLSPESEEKLALKNGENSASGIMTTLQAVNSFGYKLNNSSIKESNYVKAEIAYAGFALKKTDSITGEAVSGATFMLEKVIGDGTELIAQETSKADGMIYFRKLETGSYVLTEMKTPDGYQMPVKRQWTVTVTFDPTTNLYEVNLEDNNHAGNNNDPFIIENKPIYELPSTGGVGIYWYMFGGVLLMLAAALITYRNRRKGVLES